MLHLCNMTKERYHQEVAELAQLHPTNPLLADLKKGHNVLSELYLTRAWQMYRATAPLPTVPSMAPIASPTAHNLAKDDILNDLFRKKGHIGREMRAMRTNQLLTAKTDTERKAAMQALDQKQSEWAAVQRSIRVVEATGQLPEAEPITPDMIVDYTTLTDFQLLAHLNSARASHSRTKAKIEKYDADVMQPKHPKYALWKQQEADLVRYENNKTYIQIEIEKRKNGKK